MVVSISHIVEKSVEKLPELRDKEGSKVFQFGVEEFLNGHSISAGFRC